MSVVLHEMAHSPFCIPIAQALTACGVEFQRREIPNWDRRELLRLTGGAYYAVPLLQHDDLMIYESGANSQDVARYVDVTFAQGSLFPPALDGLQAIVIEFIENEIEDRTFKLVDIHYVPAIAEVAERGMVVRHKERRFGRGCVEQWRRNAAAIRADADRLLERFEITLRHSRFLFGEQPVYADFALLGIIGNLTFRGYNQLGQTQQELARWVELMNGVRL
ncbi:MAG TPA: glutathione S-transferase N-terminal domain-containing protein [Chthoniobacteraceae bacterium]|jgi:glutathione S-transferase|nr:glutathione S-transferase N-terminal domain-containing protein [Chthoniobacteraceae bacterium]